MLVNNKINTYYQNIINLVLELHDQEFSNAEPGHCMKITGLGLNELKYLWDILNIKYPSMDTYIVLDGNIHDNMYISATKLIELRNKQENPLLVLIPSTSRTAAEDSYGNATFKEIPLDGLDVKLKNKLLAEIPFEFQEIIHVDILKYLSFANIRMSSIIDYLLALHEFGFSTENIGNFIFHLGLIPDSKLIADETRTRLKLNFNLNSITLLSSYNLPLYDRINELPLEQNSLQQDLVNFFKQENDVKTATDICKTIYENYPELNFSNWKIPDLDFDIVKLTSEDISSPDFSIEDGIKVLHTGQIANSKVRIRFSTIPNPKDIKELKYFKIVLMAVDGGRGEEITVLRKLNNTNSQYSYRNATVELNSSMIEEGTYFFKVLAEDEHGNVLNADDEFKDPQIHKEWKKVKENDSDLKKTSFNFKLSCDTEDFYYVIEETSDDEKNQRKDKLNNVLQAYFKCRISQLKAVEEENIPVPSENSNLWLTDMKKHTSTFHINYSEKHNYQINLSTKLRIIENEFLKYKDAFGHIQASLKSNSAAIGFDSIRFIPSELTSIIPNTILKLRKKIFDNIQNSNESKNGVFETTEIFYISNDIEDYVSKLATWTTKLKNQISSEELSDAERSELQRFLTELQFLDIAKIRTKLPDGKTIEALLLSPLHPLRLSWSAQLLEVFNDWEQKTRNFIDYKDSWSKNLEPLFDGQLSPENNPLVLVEPNSNKNYLYSGELAYGWGLYLNVCNEEYNERMMSVLRQLKQYLRLLFNISEESYVESDISQKMVVRHIKNYLLQHPYADKLILNLINAGDAGIFANALVELEKDAAFKDISYEVRIFKGDDRIIEHGEALRTLINPESNISEEAEAFSQPSRNRLFPKLRFSINLLQDYLKHPSKFTSHISFLVNLFPVSIELIKPFTNNRNFYLNGLITDSTVTVDDNSKEIKWNRFIQGNKLQIKYKNVGNLGIKLFENLQNFVASALASKYTESIPATQLTLNDRDKVLLEHLHDHSDWVITFDKNLGPQIFDQPSKQGKTPFLLDYVPGEDPSGISSYLTTRPTSEVLGLLGPHFEEYGLDIHNPDDEIKIQGLLEDVRSVSSSLVLQLNSSKNRAFEVIGTAFAKRVLEKKGFLYEAFLIPIDLHQNLFEDLPTASKSRADNLLVSIDPGKKEITISVIEIKCRQSLNYAEEVELKVRMKSQIENTIEAIKVHFDPEYKLSYDRLDRELKNKELKSLLGFYIERAFRYNFLSENAYITFNDFLQNLDKGFKLKFRQLGLIFNFSAEKSHHKEVIDEDLTYFTFGSKLILDILDPESDLNTRRLEETELDIELDKAFGTKNSLKPFIQRFNPSLTEITTDESLENNDDNPSNTNTTNENEDNVISQKLEIENSAETDIDSMSIIPNEPTTPKYDILIGKTSKSAQFGILGESLHGKKIAIDLSETNTMSLFGVQGGGKSYTIGTITEMVLKQFENVNELPSPLAGVIFHYSESMQYEPEYTSMIYPNDKEDERKKLKDNYGAEPDNIEDVILLTPKDKIEERKLEYPSLEVLPISFNSKELNVQDWMFLLGAIGNDSTYIKQLKAIMKEHRRNITLSGITESVESSELLSTSQKALARQKLSFAREYIDDSFMLRDTLKPGRLIIVDLRDEFIVKDEALGLFVIMLNIFSGVKSIGEKHFNKFIVFDEAHKYMNNKDLTGNIVTAIREMRHKGVSIMIASQDPPSLPNEIIELSSIVLLHKFNSPSWLKHVQKSIIQLSTLSASDMAALNPGEGFLWATKATEKSISSKPVKISTRPRVTKHGGSTIRATGI